MKLPSKQMFVYANAAIILFTAALFGYWYFLDAAIFPPVITTADSLALKTDKTTYRSGEMISVYNSFCKARNVSSTIDVRFVDGIIVSMASINRNLPIGCYGIDKPYLAPLVVVPKGLSPGEWRVEYTVSIKINPIKTVVLERRSLPFQIVE